MRKMINILSKGLAVFAFVATFANVNSACTFFVHQPEVPEEAMKLKKW